MGAAKSENAELKNLQRLFLEFVSEWIDTGVEMGLERLMAETLVWQTIHGSLALLNSDPDKTPRDWIAEISSPGGTTMAAMEVLDAGGTLRNAIFACRNRAIKLNE